MGTTFGNVTNHGENSVTSQGNTGFQSVNQGAPGPAGGSAAHGPALLDAARRGTGTDRRRNVFVVYGRDEQVRRAMFQLLQRLDLRPLEWEDLIRASGQASPFLGEVVAAAPALAQAALVLLTPDDLVRLHPDLLAADDPDDERYATGQPRPNVLLELGMVLMAYPRRTLMVEFGRTRRIADLAGRNVIRFDGSATAVGKIVERLKGAECEVDDTGSEWRDLTPYRDLVAYRRGPGT